MSITNSTLSTTSLKAGGYLACLVGGYTLHKLLTEINKIAVKKLGLPIDNHNGKSYKEFTEANLKPHREIAEKIGCGLNRQLGVFLGDILVTAAREEIFYRFLLDRVLSRITSNFTASTTISSLLFASEHLHIPIPKEPLTSLFLNATIVGIICSIARKKFGLLGAIFIHMGFNTYGWQYMYDQKFGDIFEKIRAIHLGDLLLPEKVALFIAGMIRPAFSPLVLLRSASMKLLASRVEPKST